MRRVSVERHGGVAGVTRRGSLPGARLSRDERRALETLMGVTPSAAALTAVDRFSWRVLVEDHDGPRELRIGEADVPEAARAVLRRVLDEGRGG